MQTTERTASRGTAPVDGESVPLEIAAPMSGDLVSLDRVPDELFSSGAMGEGVAILPRDGTVVAPCDGEVLYSTYFSHAVGLSAADGSEILIHIGLDSAGEGSPFRYHVHSDQKVRKGDLLLTVDLDALRRAGKRLYTPVTVTNAGRGRSPVLLPLGRRVRAGERLMTVERDSA